MLPPAPVNGRLNGYSSHVASRLNVADWIASGLQTRRGDRCFPARSLFIISRFLGDGASLHRRAYPRAIVLHTMSSTVFSIPVYIPIVRYADAPWFIPWVVSTGRDAVSITVTTYGIPCDLVRTGGTYPLPPDGDCRIDCVTISSRVFSMVFNMRVVGGRRYFHLQFLPNVLSALGFPPSVLRLLGDPSVVKVTNDYECKSLTLNLAVAYKAEQLFWYSCVCTAHYASTLCLSPISTSASSPPWTSPH